MEKKIDIRNPLYQEDLKQISEYIKPEKSQVNILVTGATGLIGSLAVDALLYFNRSPKAADIKIYAMSRKMEKLRERFFYAGEKDGLFFIEQDVIVPLKEDISYDYIIHAASNADPRMYALYPAETIRTNMEGTIQMLEYARKHQRTKVLFTSTMEVYGKAEKSAYAEADYGLVDFNNIRSGYPESKRTAELLCRSYQSEYGVYAVIARLGYIYGPTMTKEDSKVAAQFIRNVLAGQDIVLKSRGEQRRSYCYGADAVAGIFAVLFRGKAGEAYNIANASSVVSIAEMAETAAKIAGKQVVFELPDEIEQRGFSKAQDVLLKTEKLERLGWRGRYMMEEGIRRTVEILYN